MATYRQFEEIPVWQAAIELAAHVFDLTARPAFKYRGDLVNQIRRAALSVSNNIAEGYERGTTNDLIHFLYIARGYCGETRSMTHFAVRLGGMDEEREAIEEVRARRENVSRQLFGWIDSLQNSDIKGVRHLNDQTRRDYALTAARKDFREKLEALMALKDLEQTTGRTSNADKAPSCPTCGGRWSSAMTRTDAPSGAAPPIRNAVARAIGRRGADKKRR